MAADSRLPKRCQAREGCPAYVLWKVLKLDELMPTYDVKAAYAIQVAAEPQRVWEELLNADFTGLPIARRLMMLRSFGRRQPKPSGPRTLNTLGASGSGGFLEIARLPQEEIVLAIVGKFWRPDAPLLCGWKTEDFSTLPPHGHAKAAWNFYLKRDGDQTILSTETRVLCRGRGARFQFRLYWLLIGFFSGWIRKEILQAVKRNCERPAMTNSPS
jgi:hypothetical protein